MPLSQLPTELCQSLMTTGRKHVSALGSWPPRVHVINLDSDTDRFAKCRDQLQNTGASLARVSRGAVLGKALTHEQLAEVVAPEYVSVAIPSVVGCALSHRNAWKLAAETLGDDDEWLVVLEDDVEINPHIWEQLRDILPSVGDNVDVLLLGYFGTGRPETHAPTLLERTMSTAGLGSNPHGGVSCNSHLFVPTQFGGCHAYMLRRAGARRLLETMGLVVGHVDMQMSREAAAGRLRILAVSEPLAWQTYASDGKGTHNASARPFILNSIAKRFSLGNDPRSPPVDVALSYKFFRVGPYHGKHASVQAWHGFFAAAGLLGGLLVSNIWRVLLFILTVFAVLMIVDLAVEQDPSYSQAGLQYVVDIAVAVVAAVVGSLLRHLVFAQFASRVFASAPEPARLQ